MAIPEAMLAYAAYKIMKETVGTPDEWVENAIKKKKSNATKQSVDSKTTSGTKTLNELENELLDSTKESADAPVKQQSIESPAETFGIAGMKK